MGTTLAHGDFLPEERQSISQAAEAAGSEVEFVSNAEEARTSLARRVPASVITLEADANSAQVAAIARTGSETAGVCVLVASSEVSDSVFRAAMSWGADDVLRRSPGLPGLRVRMESAAASAGQSFHPRRGMALLGDTHGGRRAAFRRTLEGAGFGVRNLSSPAELAAATTDLRIALWVVSTSFAPAADELLERARSAGVMAKVIIVVEDDAGSELVSRLEDDDACRVVPGNAPADNVLFLANEMAGQEQLSGRATPRSLVSTVVEFRSSDAGLVEHGLSYNVSQGGLYVRTMAPPASEEVQLAVRLPGEGGELRLEGEVAWRRRFGADGQATAPPGFGVKLAGPEHAMEAWRKGVAALRRAAGRSS